MNPLNVVNDPFWQADDLDVFDGWGSDDDDDDDPVYVVYVDEAPFAIRESRDEAASVADDVEARYPSAHVYIESADASDVE
jgi:hypothetical protein